MARPSKNSSKNRDNYESPKEDEEPEKGVTLDRSMLRAKAQVHEITPIKELLSQLENDEHKNGLTKLLQEHEQIQLFREISTSKPVNTISHALLFAFLENLIGTKSENAGRYLSRLSRHKSPFAVLGELIEQAENFISAISDIEKVLPEERRNKLIQRLSDAFNGKGFLGAIFIMRNALYNYAVNNLDKAKKLGFGKERYILRLLAFERKLNEVPLTESLLKQLFRLHIINEDGYSGDKASESKYDIENPIHILEIEDLQRVFILYTGEQNFTRYKIPEEAKHVGKDKGKHKDYKGRHKEEEDEEEKVKPPKRESKAKEAKEKEPNHDEVIGNYWELCKSLFDAFSLVLHEGGKKGAIDKSTKEEVKKKLKGVIEQFEAMDKLKKDITKEDVLFDKKKREFMKKAKAFIKGDYNASESEDEEKHQEENKEKNKPNKDSKNKRRGGGSDEDDDEHDNIKRKEEEKKHHKRGGRGDSREKPQKRKERGESRGKEDSEDERSKKKVEEKKKGKKGVRDNSDDDNDRKKGASGERKKKGRIGVSPETSDEDKPQGPGLKKTTSVEKRNPKESLSQSTNSRQAKCVKCNQFANVDDLVGFFTDPHCMHKKCLNDHAAEALKNLKSWDDIKCPECEGDEGINIQILQNNLDKALYDKIDTKVMKLLSL